MRYDVRPGEGQPGGKPQPVTGLFSISKHDPLASVNGSAKEKRWGM
jgi:hypothetical protein